MMMNVENVPMPYARTLETYALPRPNDVVAAVEAVLTNKCFVYFLCGYGRLVVVC
ncbi:hypothetical protein JYU34_004005 [Plutella xylostella]|uniref:Uncharacterized protein n=1 Tax=Plutella xylostella TaxID=51655 RepID=A0ABQ7QWZ0_PLUXY|nr:hypothetical protein JYU34_004005 [Plutella xylostella]